jgi:hypothetical protein
MGQKLDLIAETENSELNVPIGTLEDGNKT